MKCSYIESHALHLFCLVLPDFLNYPSAVALASDYPAEVKMGLELKRLGNAIQETIGGRAIHPVNAVVGGFGKLPTSELVEVCSSVADGRCSSVVTKSLSWLEWLRDCRDRHRAKGHGTGQRFVRPGQAKRR